MPKEKSLRHRPRPAPLQFSPKRASSSGLSTIMENYGDEVPLPDHNAISRENLATESLSVKKLLPSRSRQLEILPVKSAMKSPILSPPTNSDTLSPVISPPNSPTSPKAVHFSVPQPNSPTQDSHTLHYTHSPQDYDRSRIVVDRSLRLPPRAREDPEDEPNAEDPLSNPDAPPAPNHCSWQSFDALGSGSALDGF
ncbi:hypothetical protein CROQUDRAFT_712499 [Cronartium quercuum f. sp. fusiforme G11]|uniref:Uncharacterized protein n=1 Tax=Cronartium quercuum f. sp. fusiforme G11 TaxID=708437 RepID=A0A9P6NZA8_9BASI|nr:hypothetical protein CROQUDRAFT_712499 [Cronartium quercuum f. sp. fusiforme G11]